MPCLFVLEKKRHRWVKKGLVPGAIPGTQRWDRNAIDWYLDRASGLATESASSDPLADWQVSLARRKQAKQPALNVNIYVDKSHLFLLCSYIESSANWGALTRLLGAAAPYPSLVISLGGEVCRCPYLQRKTR